MAVNVSTAISVCLYCKTTSESDATKEFHEIFDEVGVELQLPTLVEKFFRIKAKNEDKQSLCEDCVNNLIELYDLEEHTKQEHGKAENSLGVNVQPEAEEEKNSEVACTEEVEKLNPEYLLKCTKQLVKEVNEQHTNLFETLTTEYTNIKIIAQEDKDNDGIHENETEDNDNIAKDKTAYYAREAINNTENFINNLVIENDEQSFNNIIASTTADVTSAAEEECSEDIVFVEDEEEENENNSNILIGTHISSEEFELMDENENDEEIEEDEQNSENHYSYNNKNEFIEEPQQKENVSTFNTPTEENEALTQDAVENEELELVYYEEDLPSDNENEGTSNEAVLEDLKTINRKLNSLQTEDESTVDLDNESLNSNNSSVANINKDVIDAKKAVDNDEDDPQEDTYSLEEEYLVEDIICSQEYDTVDLNEYLDKVLVTKFQDLQLNWDIECELCHDKYNNLPELLQHNCVTEFEEEQQYRCIFKDCGEDINNLQTLARHLVLHHYDKLENTIIYSKCPDCQKTFSNFIELNKHSCCRNIKKKTGAPNHCQSCNLDFQSLKRFVFHMQFHLTNHRPKVCLLCGALFNNSNDFFEHTQYKHNPATAMACIECDRFFKEKEVYDSHMELHEESKYQYACSYCPKKYTNKAGLNQHVDIYHNNKSSAIQCDFCEKEFVNQASYRNHVKSHAADVQIETYVCSTCGFITNDCDLIKEHIEADAESPCFSSPLEEKLLALGYTCENCSIDFHTIKQLKEHRLSNKHKDTLFFCGICRRAFNSLRHMRNHAINHKDFEKWQEAFPITRYFVCNIGDCQEFYPIWTSLYYHKKRPHKSKEVKDDKPLEFKCQFCQQLCTSKMSLAVHVARSHNNSNISCSHCKRTYKTQKLLQEHIDKFHTAIKCEVCFKNFKNRRNLESHRNLVHLNMKRYFCQYCEKGYFHKSEKEAHEKKVHSEFPYKCEICDFMTNYEKSLEVHMDKHNNQQKFKCTICNKTFGRKQLLTIHTKRHENKKEYICSNYLNEDGCSAAFYTYNLLKTHIQTKHQNDNKRKRSLKKYVVQVDDKSYEIFNVDEESTQQVKRSKTVTSIENNDKFEQDAIELVLEEDDIESLHEQTSDEFETICA
ncbi:Zinc finger protein 26 [Lucilia cuprina]|nr:Zinc finger protein 26 [Lucilia cuprina]